MHTQPPRTKLDDHRCMIKSPRRLFPQRRTTWSIVDNLKTASLCGQWPDEAIRTTGYDSEAYEQDCSDDGSSSSSGTVKTNALSRLDSPNPGSWLPLESCLPLEQTCSSCPPQCMKDLVRIVSNQSCLATPVSTAKESKGTFTPPLYYTGKAAQRRVRINSRPEVWGPLSKLGFMATQSLPNLREATCELEPSFGSTLGLENAIYRVKHWDASVQLHTIATMSQRGRIDTHHHAQILVTIPKQNIDTARICLTLIITHGPQGSHEFHLEAGHSSLHLGEGSYSMPSGEGAKAEIEITRTVCDMERPLDLYFSSSYLTLDHYNSSQVLPSFRPSIGRVLSESVYLSEPLGPVSMRTIARSMYSSWKAMPHPQNYVSQFKRIDTPPLYPLGLRDDLRIEVSELCAVKFDSLDGLAVTDVVWNFDIKVRQIPETALECQMSLCLEVGFSSNKLVTIDSHGWTPTYFLVDGRLATEHSAEWRQLDGQLTLFKQAHMLPGPLKLELNWREILTRGRSDSKGAYKLLLPTVLGREVLGGSVICEEVGTAFLTNPGAGNDIEVVLDTRLPTLHKGYALCLQQTPPKQEAALSPIVENDEPDSDTVRDDGSLTADTASAGTFVTSPENPIAESDPDAIPEEHPDLEANNDPFGGDGRNPEATEYRKNRIRYWILGLIFLITAIAFLYSGVPSRSTSPPNVGRGENKGRSPDLRLSHEVTDLTYPSSQSTRLSFEGEHVAPRGDSMEDLGLETLTDSMIAGTEAYGEKEEDGWRWWRDVFDYTFGWQGPVYE